MATPQQFEHDGFNGPNEVEVAQRNAKRPTMAPATDDSLPFSVWRETRILPRRRLAAFRALEDATRFAEMRARIEGENDAHHVDTTIWASCADGSEALLVRHSAALAKASEAAS